MSANILDKLTLDRNAMKDRATGHLRIYVGGLTDKVTIEELYEHFIQYGEINGVIVNRNFGFVQFLNESSAQDAIKKADGSVFHGKSLSVRTSQKNSDRPPKPTEVVTVHSEVPPAVALTDNVPIVEDDGDEQYDSYGNFIGDKGYDDYEEAHPVSSYDARARGRGLPRGRARAVRGRSASGFRDRSPIPDGRRGGMPWNDHENYDRFGNAYPSRALPVPERNDCEIIVVSKALTEYAEYVEGRLKRLGIVVDLLFPMEDVPIGKVLGNIASRGCLYAILVMPQNQEHRSLTLTILHGLPQEHRNMPLEDALQLISRNFQEVQRGGATGREAVYALLGQLADGRSLTVLQYDKVIEYLKERREQQIKIEVGEAPASKEEEGLQQRILSILNEKITASKPEPVPPPQTKLLDDPSVKKALDSVLLKFV